MHIKFLRHGKGDACSSVAYLLGTHDHKGEKRPVVEVLRGDPHLVAAVANGTNRTWKYSSAVLSFHADDKPTPDQLSEAMDAFERSAFGHQPRENFSFAWVGHGDHLHFLCARTRLDSGLAFNPCPPGAQKRYDKARDYLNKKHGWADPADPARARAGRAADSADHFDRVMGESTAAARRWVDSRVRTMVLNGSISSRDDLLSWLSSKGFVVTRSGKSVSIESPQGKRLRLKGAPFYERDFDPQKAQAYRLAQSQTPQQQPASQEEVKSAEAAFAEAVARWDDHLAGRPKRPKPAPVAQQQPAPKPVPVPVQVPQIIVSPPTKERSIAMREPVRSHRHNPLLAGFTNTTPNPIPQENEHDRSQQADDELAAIDRSVADRVRRLFAQIDLRRKRPITLGAQDAGALHPHPAPDDGDAGQDGGREKSTPPRVATNPRPDGRHPSDATKSIAPNDPLADIRSVISRYPVAEALAESVARSVQEWQAKKRLVREKAVARQRAQAWLEANPGAFFDSPNAKPQPRRDANSPWGSGPRPR